jgi:hypothetical protein
MFVSNNDECKEQNWFYIKPVKPGHYVSAKFNVNNLITVQNCIACCQLTTQHCKAMNLSSHIICCLFVTGDFEQLHGSGPPCLAGGTLQTTEFAVG